MGRIFLNVGVISAIWSGVSAVRRSREAPKDWKLALTLAGAAISVVLAVTSAIDAAKEADAEGDD